MKRGRTGLAGRKAGRREIVAGKPRRAERRVDLAEIEAAEAAAALVRAVGRQAQAEVIGGLGIDLEPAGVFALLAGAVVGKPVVVGQRARNSHGQLVAKRQVDRRLPSQPVVIAVAEPRSRPRCRPASAGWGSR